MRCCLVVAVANVFVAAGTRPAPAASSSVRAAFYYPWFPQAWAQQGQNPFTNYVPARGFYQVDATTVHAQVLDMQYAGISTGIASWFGQGTTTDQHWPALMQGAAGTGFTWAPYYEPEGISNPKPAQIAADLHYISTNYGGPGSNLLRVNGNQLVVFVYNADDTTHTKGCHTVTRWKRARKILAHKYGESIYLDLKVFPQYSTCQNSPLVEGWHQYGPASADQNFSKAPGDGSYSISPGYWKSGAAYGSGTFLVRDRTRWQHSIATMNASGAHWQLITTYNEWGEGTAVESSSGCRNPAPPGALCDWSGTNGTSQFLTDLHDAPPT